MGIAISSPPAALMTRPSLNFQPRPRSKLPLTSADASSEARKLSESFDPSETVSCLSSANTPGSMLTLPLVFAPTLNPRHLFLYLDDADIHAWPKGTDTTIRLVQAIVAACKAEPSMNVWYDSTAGTRVLVQRVDIAIEAFGRHGAPLWIGGEGQEAHRVSRVPSNVRLLGQVPQAELQRRRCR